MADPKVTPDRTEKRYWLDNKRNVDKLYWGLVAICTVLFCADFFYHKHVHFELESRLGFFGWYGFVCCAALVLAAKGLRRIVRRDEDYYD